MIVTVSGHAGSGKSTAATLLARKLGYAHYSAGDLRRKMARERGISLAALNRLGEREAFTDKEVDDYQQGVLAKQDRFVIDGRVSFHFIPGSVKVFLTAALEERAKRVFQDERESERFRTVREAREALLAREASDRKRYRKYYGVDCFDPKHYDLVIDTTALRPAQVVGKILAFLRSRPSAQGR